MTTQEKKNLLGMTLIIAALSFGIIIGASSIVLAVITAGTTAKYITLLLGFSGAFILIASAFLCRALLTSAFFISDT